MDNTLRLLNSITLHYETQKFFKSLEYLKQARITPPLVYDHYYSTYVRNPENERRLKIISLLLDIDSNRSKQLLAERKIVDTYFKTVVDQNAFLSDEHIRLRQLLIDWYTALRSSVTATKKLTDVFTLSAHALNDLLQSFGYPYYRYLSTVDKKIYLLINLMTYYKHKGSITQLKDILILHGFRGKVISEWWLYKNLRRQAGQTDEEFERDFLVKNRVIATMVEIDNITEAEQTISYDAFYCQSDPNWYYDKNLSTSAVFVLSRIYADSTLETRREGVKDVWKRYQRENIIEYDTWSTLGKYKKRATLPSILPYISLDTYTNLNRIVAESSYLRAMLQSQYETWLRNCIVFDRTDIVGVTALLTNSSGNSVLKHSSDLLEQIESSLITIDLSCKLPAYYNFYSKVEEKNYSLPEETTVEFLESLNISLLEVYLLVSYLASLKFFPNVYLVHNQTSLTATGQLYISNDDQTLICYNGEWYSVKEKYDLNELLNNQKFLLVRKDPDRIIVNTRFYEYNGKWSPIYFDNSVAAPAISLANIQEEFDELNEFYTSRKLESPPPNITGPVNISYIRTQRPYSTDYDKYHKNYYPKLLSRFSKINSISDFSQFSHCYFVHSEITDINYIENYYDETLYQNPQIRDKLLFLLPIYFKVNPFLDRVGRDDNNDIIWSNDFVTVINQNSNITSDVYTLTIVTYQQTPYLLRLYGSNIFDRCSDCSNYFSCNLSTRADFVDSNCSLVNKREGSIFLRRRALDRPERPSELANSFAKTEILLFGIKKIGNELKVRTYADYLTAQFELNVESYLPDYVKLTFEVTVEEYFDPDKIGFELEVSFISRSTSYDTSFEDNRVLEFTVKKPGKYTAIFDLHKVDLLSFKLKKGYCVVRVCNFNIDRNTCFRPESTIDYVISRPEIFLPAISPLLYSVVRTKINEIEQKGTAEEVNEEFYIFVNSICSSINTYLSQLGFKTVTSNIEFLFTAVGELLKKIVDFFKPYRVRLKNPTIFAALTSRVENTQLEKDVPYYLIKQYFSDEVTVPISAQLSFLIMQQIQNNYLIPESPDKIKVDLVTKIDQSNFDLMRYNHSFVGLFQEYFLADEAVFKSETTNIQLLTSLTENFYYAEDYQTKLDILISFFEFNTQLNEKNKELVTKDTYLLFLLDEISSLSENDTFAEITLNTPSESDQLIFSLNLKDSTSYGVAHNAVNLGHFSVEFVDDTAIIIFEEGFVELNTEDGSYLNIDDTNSIFYFSDNKIKLKEDHTNYQRQGDLYILSLAATDQTYYYFYNNELGSLISAESVPFLQNKLTIRGKLKITENNNGTFILLLAIKCLLIHEDGLHFFILLPFAGVDFLNKTFFVATEITENLVTDKYPIIHLNSLSYDSATGDFELSITFRLFIPVFDILLGFQKYGLEALEVNYIEWKTTHLYNYPSKEIVLAY